MTAPFPAAPGFVQLPGGYVPNPPQGVPAPQGNALPPGLAPAAQSQQPQAQPQVQPQAAPPVDPRLQFQQAGPPGSPIDSAPPPGQQPPVAPVATPPVLSLDTRLSGQGVPSELQGRSLGEVMHMYDRMRNIVLDRAASPSGVPTAPMQRPQAQPQQQSQPQPQGQPQQQTGWDWKNPQASIAAVVQQELAGLQQSLQPVLQQTSQMAVKAARDSIAAEVGPSFAHYEPLVLAQLQGADPQLLQNPQMWRLALQSVVGELALKGQAPQIQRPMQPAPAQGAQPWTQPAQAVPFAGVQPMPNLNSFWTEQPTHGAPSTAPQLTPTQKWAADAMGMSVSDYLAWSGGIPTAGGMR